MKVRFLLGCLAAVGVWLATAAVAWGDPIPLCNGQPCVSSWYTSPVSVTWDLNGGSNGGGCAPQNYVSDVNQSFLQSEPMSDWPAWTYCYDPTSGVQKDYFIKIEVSSPTATVAPSRAPDSNGWYNHAVTGIPSANAFSVIASCTSTSYAGPDTTSATVSSTCVDNAGKSVTATSAPFAYDTTAPSLTATATTGDRTVDLSWQAGGDIAPITAIDVVRSPGSAGAAADPVYAGTSSGYQDTNVSDGVTYTYTVTAYDAAGNASTQTLTATPKASLLAPANSARLAGPPLLSWTPVRDATYYNVQLFRNGKKVQSVWPTNANLQLRRSWRYRGRRYTLKPGRYRWFVWPGFGKRRAARYGDAIGSWTFVIAR